MVADLIEAGFLSRFTTYAPPRSPDLCGLRTRMGALRRISIVMATIQSSGDATMVSLRRGAAMILRDRRHRVAA